MLILGPEAKNRMHIKERKLDLILKFDEGFNLDDTDTLKHTQAQSERHLFIGFVGQLDARLTNKKHKNKEVSP